MFVEMVYRPLVPLAVALAMAGCGNDFDALFEGAADAGTTEGGGVAPEAGAGVEAGPDGPSACSPREECEEGECDYGCNQSGCSCPKFECREGRRSCDATCVAGSACDLDCDADQRCSLDCQGCDGKLRCKEHANACSATCATGGKCDVTCDNEGTCAVVCQPGAQCLLSCTNRPSSCNLDCQGEAPVQCGASKVFACRRACP